MKRKNKEIKNIKETHKVGDIVLDYDSDKSDYFNKIKIED